MMQRPFVWFALMAVAGVAVAALLALLIAYIPS